MIGGIAGAALVLWLVAACGSDTATPGDADPEPTPGIRGDYVSDGLPAPFGEGDVLRLTLANGTISFQATCNTMSGNATWDDGSLVVTNVGGTEMGCPGAGFEQDEWLVDFFTSEPAIRLDGGDVAIARGEDEIWFVPASEGGAGAGPDVPLDGTVWTLTGIEETDGDSVGIMVIPPKVQAILTIEGDRVAVETGCNTGGGKVTVRDDLLVLRGMGFTLVGCLGVAGEVERGVLRVLDGSVLDWSISGTRLRLANGDRALVFEAE
jgi:heat shock protein HslJ